MLQTRVFASDDRIRRVLSKIQQDPSISVQQLAVMVHLSGSRLGHLFKTETGMELRHFLVDARLDKAAELLRRTDMQIKEISHVIGYQHVPSFDRVFRRKFRSTPLDYRREQPAGDSENAGAEPAYAAGVANSRKS